MMSVTQSSHKRVGASDSKQKSTDYLKPHLCFYFVFTGQHKDYIKRVEDAMREFHENTCLKFKKRDRERDYVEIVYGSGYVNALNFHINFY